MECYRCKSDMIPCGPLSYYIGDTLTDGRDYKVFARYCIICGNYEDSTVLANRNPKTRIKVKRGETEPRYRKATYMRFTDRKYNPIRLKGLKLVE